MKKIVEYFYKADKSALLTIVGIVILFASAVVVTLYGPPFWEKDWSKPTSFYQQQMYEVADPNIYLSSRSSEGSQDLQRVYHLKENYTLLAFSETETFRIIAPPPLEKFITRYGEETLKLTSKLLLLRAPQKTESFDAFTKAKEKELALQKNQQNGSIKIDYQIKELYQPSAPEAFSLAPGDGVIENWVDEKFVILDDNVKQLYHQNTGVVYVNNPEEYRVQYYQYGKEKRWRYSPQGSPIENLEKLKGDLLGFVSRKELIEQGENVYQSEGCWYCHTDQTRTLIQDVVVNGSDSEPAPPSSPGEYVYQKTSFLGTRRIGPDISRVGVKRPNRDWHKAHFWAPKTESPGSIMPRFQHFFDFDPRGTSKAVYGVPNYKFEAIYQYLMTKGTRITAPTEAWWLGRDPVQTKAVIEGRRKLKKG